MPEARIDRLPFRRRRLADYEAMYAAEPPWETNRPQHAYASLATAGGFNGRVLDVGCGSGEHALLAASLGHPAVGVDSAPSAIKRAREKAAARSLDARFLCLDVQRLPQLNEQFDTLIDAGMFHTLDDDQRPTYAAATAGVAAPGAHLHVLCFSDAEPGFLGPRRVSPNELVHALAGPWCPVTVARTTMDTTSGEGRISGLLGEFVLGT